MFFKKGFIIVLSIFSFIIPIEVGLGLTADREQPPALIWEVPNYNIGINTISKDILIGLNLSPKDKDPDLFGISLAKDYENAEAFWVIELYDATEDRLIKRITLDEMLGLSKDKGCQMILNFRDQKIEQAASSSQEEALKTAYVIKDKGYDLTLIRTYKLERDENLPGGTKLKVDFTVVNNSKNIFDLKVSSRHRAEDYQEAVSRDVILALKERGYPILIQRYSPIPLEIKLYSDKNSKALPDICALSFDQVMLIPGKEAELFSVEYSIATTEGRKEARIQAENIISYLKTKRPGSVFIGRALASDTEPVPGDIVTYTLNYVNNGTGNVSSAIIQIPIPLHTEYIPGSARSFFKEADLFYSIDEGKSYLRDEPLEKPPIVVTRANEEKIASPRITNLKWVAKEAIKAGEGIEISFKVRVN